MMKKIIGLFLAALMVVLLTSVTAMADEGTISPDNPDGNIGEEWDPDGANIDDYVSFQFNGGRLTYQGREYLISARFPYYSDRGPYTLPTSIGREGYVFDGWYEKDDFTGAPLVTIPQGAHGPRKVWAKWNAIQGEEGETSESLTEPEAEPSNNPLTKDNNTIGFFLILMIVSLCTIGAATVSVKKK